MAYFQVQTVSFREGNFSSSPPACLSRGNFPFSLSVGYVDLPRRVTARTWKMGGFLERLGLFLGAKR